MLETRKPKLCNLRIARGLVDSCANKPGANASAGSALRIFRRVRLSDVVGKAVLSIFDFMATALEPD